jgi:biotin-(acetyl-CoA carboxylase) ligase
VHPFGESGQPENAWEPEHFAFGLDSIKSTNVVENFGINDNLLEDAERHHLSEIPLTPLFTLAAGVACAETVASLTGLSIQLKPINDLYVEGRKLGGILTESLISENRCKALITGIGINIREHEDIQAGCALESRGHHPISLQRCIPQQLFDQWHPDALRKELCESIALAVDAQYQRLARGQASELLASYLQYKLPDVEMPEAVERVLASL